MVNKTPKEQLVNMAYKAGAIASSKKKIRIEQYNKNPKLCKHCNKPIPYEKRVNNFCSQSCSTTYNNLRRKKSPELTEILKNKVCKYCGKPIIKRPSETYNKALKRSYCSLDCKIKHAQQLYIEKWKSGEVDGTESANVQDINNRLREYLLEKAHYKCEICGWHGVNPTTGKTPLQVHHIDGDSTNNTESNLQVLCPNCHSLTPNYGASNRNSKRTYRKKHRK